MVEIIKNAVLRMFPEMSGGLHLDRYARILAVNDAPESGATSERFRPRYAVDIEILTPEGEKDERFPTYEAVPLPLASAGHEAGQYGFPEVGALVVLGFAYGRPDHPIIRQVYPLGFSQPSVKPGELLWQQDPNVLQRVDTDGNWLRVTNNSITDESVKRFIHAVEVVEELGRELRVISENSTEKIGGTKLIEAMGALKLLTGGQLNISAGGNLNQTTGSNRSDITGGNAESVTGGNRKATIKGSDSEAVTGAKTQTVGGSHTQNVTGKKTVSAAGLTETINGELKTTTTGASTETVAGTKKIIADLIDLKGAQIKMGNGSVDFLQVVIAFMEEVRLALEDLATHTHKDGTITPHDQQGEVEEHRDNVATLKGQLEGISQ